jgi:hypothetical protein
MNITLKSMSPIWKLHIDFRVILVPEGLLIVGR